MSVFPSVRPALEDRRAKAEDDDWDKVKAASSLAGEGMEAVARQMLNDYVLQHRTLMERIGKDEDMPPAEKVEALSSPCPTLLQKPLPQASAFYRE